MQKVIGGIEKDARQMLRDLDKVVREKTKNSPLDLFTEKDEFGKTKFILKEKVEGEDEVDEQILNYLRAEPSTRKRLLKEIKKKNIMKVKATSLFENK